MRLPPLGLMRGRHVAEAALERAVVEYRRRAGAVVDCVQRLLGNRDMAKSYFDKVMLAARADRVLDSSRQGSRFKKQSAGRAKG
jgi:hypothetical protein